MQVKERSYEAEKGKDRGMSAALALIERLIANQ
jgi:hypothetical protein